MAMVAKGRIVWEHLPTGMVLHLMEVRVPARRIYHARSGLRPLRNPATLGNCRRDGGSATNAEADSQTKPQSGPRAIKSCRSPPSSITRSTTLKHFPVFRRTRSWKQRRCHQPIRPLPGGIFWRSLVQLFVARSRHSHRSLPVLHFLWTLCSVENRTSKGAMRTGFFLSRL